MLVAGPSLVVFRWVAVSGCWLLAPTPGAVGVQTAACCFSVGGCWVLAPRRLGLSITEMALFTTRTHFLQLVQSAGCG